MPALTWRTLPSAAAKVGISLDTAGTPGTDMDMAGMADMADMAATVATAATDATGVMEAMATVGARDCMAGGVMACLLCERQNRACENTESLFGYAM